MPRVYIANKSGHDFSAAAKYGELVFLSEGRMSKFATNNMYRLFVEQMRGSSDNDWLLVTGLTVMNNIATAILAFKHGQINMLIYDEERNDYRKRVIKLTELITEGGD